MVCMKAKTKPPRRCVGRRSCAHGFTRPASADEASFVRCEPPAWSRHPPHSWPHEYQESCRENLRGARSVAIICFGCWAVSDALMKLVIRSLPELQTVFIRNLFVTPLLALIALSRGELLPVIAKSERWKVLGRVLGDVFTTYFVLAAIHGGHLANVAIILGAQPLLIMLGAATCLGERVDRVAWAIGLLGMLGVVLAAQQASYPA